MPHIDRTLFKRKVLKRTVLLRFFASIILVGFFSTGTRVPAAAAETNPYAAPARDFARRIASSFSAGTRVSMDVRNRSTLDASDVAAVRAGLLSELAAHGLRIATTAADVADGDVTASATITLSENATGFLWVAEIRQGDRSSVMLIAVPRAAAAALAASGITLHSALLWSGPERVLAAATSPTATSPAAAGAPGVLLLVTDGTSALVIDALHTFKIALPAANHADRDAQGTLAWNGNTVTATLSNQTCAYSSPLSATSQAQCHAADAVHASTASATLLGPQRADMPSACGAGDSGEILVTGAGDYTQPDSIRAYEMRDGAVEPASAALEFPGPVMALDVQTSATAVAVVHNLATRDDEVYEISLVCGH